MHDTDWQRIAPEVARQLLGEPTSVKSNEWRWGNKGSMVFTLDTGQFYDFEEGVGFGVAGLIKHLGKNVEEVLKQHGFERPLPHLHSLSSSSPATKSSGRSFSREQMVDLWKQAVIKMKYSEDFMVLRFPEGHHIRQKYAPFTKQPNGSWSMNRPEGLMPLFITNNYPDKPVLISEGEKACQGSATLHSYDVCTWHGGCNSWDKSDWSKIYGRDVVIWPDKDAAGLEVAEKISAFLKQNGCKVKVAPIPDNFKDKDDLWDAAANGYFKDPQEFEDYIRKCEEVKLKGSLTFTRADKVLQQVTNPEWLIKDCIEQRSLIQVYGPPKSGKSFIAISMACAIASGKPFYGLKTSKKPVLYICGEGQRGVKRRLAAWQQAQYDLTEVPLFLSDRAVRIGDKDDFDRLKKEIEAVVLIEGEISMLVIDTFQRCFAGGGGNENSAEDVGNFVAQLDTLIAEYGCAICLVHHSGHQGGRARGSSVIGASLDYEFKVTRNDVREDDMLVEFQQTLNKDGQGMSSMNFIFEEVELIGQGLDLTSGYLKQTDKKIEPKRVGSPEQRLVLQAINRLALRIDEDNPEDVFVMPKDLKYLIKNTKGEVMKYENYKKMFGSMKENGMLYHISKVGYQDYKFKKLEPNFTEGTNREVTGKNEGSINEKS